MPAFRDLFSFAAGSYARYRPTYPDALFDWIDSFTPGRERAWDCGTGSGQAAVALARRYDEVIASDPSVTQLANAEPARGVRYVAMTAEDSALGERTVDVVTVAQAFHWFHAARFFGEVDRVLRPGGALAIWSYGLVSVDPAIDEELQRFYWTTLGPYWPPGRSLVETGYAGIVLPYPEADPPVLSMEASWTLSQLTGFLSTWSAVGRYRAARGTDPVPDLARRLAELWRADEVRRIHWPLVLRLARKPL